MRGSSRSGRRMKRRKTCLNSVVFAQRQGAVLPRRGTCCATIAQRGKGAIVNVSTMVADYGAASMSLYGSSKAAINLLTKASAARYGPSGVRVNAVSPGPTRTEGTEAMGEGLEQLAAEAPPRAVRRQRKEVRGGHCLSGDGSCQLRKVAHNYADQQQAHSQSVSWQTASTQSRSREVRERRRCRTRDDDVCCWPPISSTSLYFLSSRFTSSPRSWFVSHRHRCAPMPRMRTAVSAPRLMWDASGTASRSAV